VSEPERYEAAHDWIDKRGGKWQVVAHWEVVEGRLTFVGFDMRSAREKPAEVAQHVMRAFPLTEVREATRLQVVNSPEYAARHPRWVPPPEWSRTRPLPKSRDQDFPGHSPMEWFTSEYHTMRAWLRANPGFFDLPARP
jgi:hypothetical protein